MKKSELKAIIKEELNKIIKEEFSIMTSNFINELKKFLKLQIKKGNIKNITIDDINTYANIMYKALIINKNMKKKI